MRANGSSPCPLLRICDNGDEGARKAARGSSTGNSTISAPWVAAGQDRQCGSLLHPTLHLVPGPPVGISIPAIVGLSSASGSCRPLAWTRRMPSSQDPHFTIPPGGLTPPHSGAWPSSAAQEYTARPNSTLRSACTTGVDRWVTCGFLQRALPHLLPSFMP